MGTKNGHGRYANRLYHPGLVVSLPHTSILPLSDFHVNSVACSKSFLTASPIRFPVSIFPLWELSFWS